MTSASSKIVGSVTVNKWQQKKAKSLEKKPSGYHFRIVTPNSSSKNEHTIEALHHSLPKNIYPNCIGDPFHFYAVSMVHVVPIAFQMVAAAASSPSQAASTSASSPLTLPSAPQSARTKPRKKIHARADEGSSWSSIPSLVVLPAISSPAILPARKSSFIKSSSSSSRHGQDSRYDDDDGDGDVLGSDGIIKAIGRPRFGIDDDDDDEGTLQVRRKRSKTDKNAAATMKRSKTPKKSVTFHRRVRIRKIPTLHSMSDSMMQAMFYSREELGRARAALWEKLQHYTDHTDIVEDEEDEYDDGGVFCLRGLENELPEGRMRRRLWKAIARKTVFLEQETQRAEGYDDPTTISLMYQKECLLAVGAAVMVAAGDEFEARMIQNEY